MKSNNLTFGILAHVDAGKTTLAEAMLFRSGTIRKIGRVDHRNAFLDTDTRERARGITIFAKQAVLSLPNRTVTLLDTPGHVDFSAEAERTLQVLDYAILVISGTDGVQGHAKTIWQLLEHYNIPTFLFINKMDIDTCDHAALLSELSGLSRECVDFSSEPHLRNEAIALCDEQAMECVLSGAELSDNQIARLIARRRLFPCFFGSALRLDGVDEFLQALSRFTLCRDYPEAFGARVYKISRDAQGTRLTHMKITGGTLRVKTLLKGGSAEERWEQKADQLRIYSGSSFQGVQEVSAGAVCAVTGLSKTFCGEGFGFEAAAAPPLLEPVLSYRIELPESANPYETYLKLQQLQEEDPMLELCWDEHTGAIQARVMGEIQMEILKSIIAERFGIEVSFSTGSILYKETIESTVEGIGHYEPLRHYAEVHLLLEPGAPNSGLRFGSICSEDRLDRNWQRLILTHLQEKVHRGVLTGSPVTDLKITLAAGRAHLKHTEGGDFRQATYRAVRQGLKKAKSILLEPIYEFRLEVPSDTIGRAMNDLQRMGAQFSPPQPLGDSSLLTGTAPVCAIRNYHRDLLSYTRGRGRILLTLAGYAPCHNADEVIADIGYDCERDSANPCGSVFCSHGAGCAVPWNEVEEHMHLESCLKPQKEEETPSFSRSAAPPLSGLELDRELAEIFRRTYGEPKHSPHRMYTPKEYLPATKKPTATVEPREKYLLVDGYNIVFAWDELRELSKINIESARSKLIDILCNYQGYRKMNLILVFDAYRVERNQGESFPFRNIHIIYTKTAETADQYIEKTVHQIGRKYDVTVATSDALEQLIIFGEGAKRISARELRIEVENTMEEIRREYQELAQTEKNRPLMEPLMDQLDADSLSRIGRP